MENRMGLFVPAAIARRLMDEEYTDNYSPFYTKNSLNDRNSVSYEHIEKSISLPEGKVSKTPSSNFLKASSYNEEKMKGMSCKASCPTGTAKKIYPKSVWPGDLNSTDDLHNLWRPFSPLPVLLSECISGMMWQDKYFLLMEIFAENSKKKDKSHSGLNFKQFQKILQVYPCVERAYIRDLFSFMDCQRVGIIQEADFISGMLVSSPEAPHLTFPKRRCSKSCITMIEQTTGLHPSALIRLQLIFLTFDADGDAVLNEIELARLLYRVLTLLCNEKRAGRNGVEEYSQEAWNSRLGKCFWDSVRERFSLNEKSPVDDSNDCFQKEKIPQSGSQNTILSKSNSEKLNDLLAPATKNIGEFMANSLKKIFGVSRNYAVDEKELSPENNLQKMKSSRSINQQNLHTEGFYCKPIGAVGDQQEDAFQDDFISQNSFKSRCSSIGIEEKNSYEKSVKDKMVCPIAEENRYEMKECEKNQLQASPKVIDEKTLNEHEMKKTPCELKYNQKTPVEHEKTASHTHEFDTMLPISFAIPIYKSEDTHLEEEGVKETLNDLTNWKSSSLKDQKCDNLKLNSSHFSIAPIHGSHLLDVQFRSHDKEENREFDKTHGKENDKICKQENFTCDSSPLLSKVHRQCDTVLPQHTKMICQEQVHEAAMNISKQTYEHYYSPKQNQSPVISTLDSELLYFWSQELTHEIAQDIIQMYDAFEDGRGLCFSMFVKAVRNNDILGTSLLFRTRQDMCSVIKQRQHVSKYCEKRKDQHIKAKNEIQLEFGKEEWKPESLKSSQNVTDDVSEKSKTYEKKKYQHCSAQEEKKCTTIEKPNFAFNILKSHPTLTYEKNGSNLCSCTISSMENASASFQLSETLVETSDNSSVDLKQETVNHQMSESFSPLQVLQQLAEVHEKNLRLARRALAAVSTIKYEGWSGLSHTITQNNENWHTSPLKIPGVDDNSLFLLQAKKNRSWVKFLPAELIYQLCEAVVQILRDESKHTKINHPVTLIANILVRENPLDFYKIHPLLEQFANGFERNLSWKKEKQATTHLLILGGLIGSTGINEMLELIVYIFSLKLLYPTALTLLRGPFDDFVVSVTFGFAKECIDRYGREDGKEIHRRLLDVLEFLPLCASVVSYQETILCLSGNLPSKGRMESFKHIKNKSTHEPIPSLLISTVQDNETFFSINLKKTKEHTKEDLLLYFELVWSAEFMKLFNARVEHNLVDFKISENSMNDKENEEKKKEKKCHKLFSKERFLNSERFEESFHQKYLHLMGFTKSIRLLPCHDGIVQYTLFVQGKGINKEASLIHLGVDMPKKKLTDSCCVTENEQDVVNEFEKLNSTNLNFQ